MQAFPGGYFIPKLLLKPHKKRELEKLIFFFVWFFADSDNKNGLLISQTVTKNKQTKTSGHLPSRNQSSTKQLGPGPFIFSFFLFFPAGKHVI